MAAHFASLAESQRPRENTDKAYVRLWSDVHGVLGKLSARACKLEVSAIARRVEAHPEARAAGQTACADQGLLGSCLAEMVAARADVLDLAYARRVFSEERVKVALGEAWAEVSERLSRPSPRPRRASRSMPRIAKASRPSSRSGWGR